MGVSKWSVTLNTNMKKFVEYKRTRLGGLKKPQLVNAQNNYEIFLKIKVAKTFPFIEKSGA